MKKINGITLIATIITVIVILILIGISIRIIINSNLIRTSRKSIQ